MFRLGEVTKYWLGDENFHRRSFPTDDIMR